MTSTPTRSFPYNLAELKWTDDTHTRNEQKKYCYCGQDYDDKQVMRQCVSCRQWFHLPCIQIPTGFPFRGDIFYVFRCAVCTQGPEEYTRQPMSWVSIVQLTLYHLGVTESSRYFRFRDVICSFIDEHWEDLQPGKQRSNTWKNTISAVLSTHPSVFVSGTEELGQPGYWALLRLTPPDTTPVKKTKNKAHRSAKAPGANDKLASPASRNTGSRSKTPITKKAIKPEPEETPTRPPTPPSPVVDPVSSPSSLSTLSTLSSCSVISWDLDSDPVTQMATESVVSATESVEPSTAQPRAEKRALENVDQKTKDSDLIEKAESHSPTKKRLRTTSPVPTATVPKVQSLTEHKSPSDLPNSYKTPLTQPQGNLGTTGPSLLPMTSVDEEALYQKLKAMPSPLSVELSRMKRRLKVRMLKRAAGLDLFNLEDRVAQTLTLPLHTFGERTAQEDVNGELSDTDARMFSRCKPRITKIPYHQSFACRLYGRLQQRNTLGTTRPWVGPLKGRTLKPFIRRDYESKPTKLRLLESIRGLPLEKRLRDPTEESSPTTVYPVDYCYVQPCHIPQVNALLADAFWPGIDISEALQYPECSVVVLYRRLVIGCAFMTPDAYITYLTVAPGWGSGGIGRFMIYHLIQISAGRDITLHVSANNPAMILYQGYGFKPEQFIIGFYDKYLPEHSQLSNNAFFLRLRR
ncbi:hypothetical protein IWQ62_000318 [Dispira parvispora]|uniref:N-acetyltransferase domain-containing protein n=1 Tax=Dispira parvispora TaxID=1520584 RepID=A0A9W8B0D1_9FUNG|nr:hypothetical protein IWQ62_000318 [Dispira parvispora]